MVVVQQLVGHRLQSVLSGQDIGGRAGSPREVARQLFLAGSSVGGSQDEAADGNSISLESGNEGGADAQQNDTGNPHTVGALGNEPTGSRVHAGVGLFLILAVSIETWHPGPVRGSAQQVGEAWEQGQRGEHRKSHTYGSHRFQRAIGTQIAEQQAQQASDHGAAGSEDWLQDTAQSGPGGFRSRFVAS